MNQKTNDDKYQEFIKKFNNLPLKEKKEKKSYTKKNEIVGRIIILFLALIPISLMLYREIRLGFIDPLIVFVIATFVVVLLNQFMSKILKLTNKEIATKPTDLLFSDKSYAPAILSRFITLLLSVAGAVVLAYLSVKTGFLNAVLFFIIGYIYFTMVQFKKL